MGNEKYIRILNRYLYTDIIMIAILILVSSLVIILLFKFLPNEKVIKSHHDWSNKIAKRVMCIAILFFCILAVCITGEEVLNIVSDLKKENFTCCTGSYTASRKEMIVRTENGDSIKLQYLHSTLEDFESDCAEIVYSERSHILLSCQVKFN